MPSKERLSAIALLAAIAGIAILFLLAESFEPKPVKISEINNGLVGWPVRVNAKVESSHKTGNTLLMQVFDGGGRIKAVLFNASKEKQALLCKNCFAILEGKVQLYKGELEIVVESVEKWN
jgi:DNA/RNA endonuclease YhcR with UshA esterase domain